MILNMRFCPPNITIHDIWINHGVSTCFLETVNSSIVSLFILIFGLGQLIFYRRYATRVSIQLPRNKLYNVQVFSHISLIVIAGLDILLRHILYDREVYGFEVLYVVAAMVTWPMALSVLVVERSYQLPTPPSHGHGFVLLMTWTGRFIAENLAFLSMDTEPWWYHLVSPEDKLAFAFWLMRYVFTVVVFILGIKAPGIRQEYNSRTPILDEETPEQNEPRVSASQGSTWRNIWRKTTTLLPYMWPKKSVGLQLRVVMCVVLLIGVRVTNVFVPIYSKKIVDGLAEKIFVWQLILAFVGLKLLQGGATGASGILNILRSFLWIRVSQYTTREIQVGVFRHLHGLSLRWHISRKTGEVLRVMDRGTQSINSLLNYIIFSILPTMVDIVIAVAYFSSEFNLWFGLIVFLTMAVYLTITITITEWRTKFRREMNKNDNEQRTKAVDSLLNFETVKYYNAESYEINRYQDAILKYQGTEWTVMATLSFLNFAQSFIMNGGLLAGSLLAGYMVSEDTKTVGDYVLFGTYIMQLMGPLNWLGTLYRVIQESFVNMENMLDLMDEPIEVSDVSNAPDLITTRGKIEFKDVTFYYTPERPILKNISFEVNPGDTVAIVGPTGSGKTTIMRLLFRFFDVKEGSIHFDGQNICHVTQNSLRKHIGVVPQDTVLFNDTIEENIKYAKPGASLDEVKSASKLAEIHDKIMQFPDGYDTVVGERGLKLSGGEKQRVAIARTLLKSPMIILLDEATSALDSATEKNIQSALNQICSNRTTLVVAHRLSTIKNANLILVLKDGEIVQRGSHETLLEMGGVYKELWDQQDKKGETKDLTKEDKSNDIVNGGNQ